METYVSPTLIFYDTSQEMDERYGNLTNDEVTVDGKLMDEMVSLRYKVRQSSIQQLKDLKKLKKELSHNDEENMLAMHIKFCEKNLDYCDETRNILMEKFGVEINDRKDKSTWKPKL